MEIAQSLDLFLTESHRYLSVLNNFLTTLQESPFNSETLDELYRLGDTLRDNAEGMGFEGISQITYNIETLLNAIQSSEYDSTAEVVDLLLGTMEVLSIQLDAIKNSGYKETFSANETVMNLSASTHLILNPLSDNSRLTQNEYINKKNVNSIRIDAEHLDTLVNLFSEFVISKSNLEQIAKDTNNKKLDESVRHLARIGANMQDIILKIRMVPIKTKFDAFPNTVHVLSKTFGKKVDFNMSGLDTELDRVLAEEIGDPLIQLLRNSLNDGIETPEERISQGKSETGRLEIRVYQADEHVYIEVSDDGRGIDRQQVIKNAVNMGLVKTEQANTMQDEQVFDLLFQPNFDISNVNISGLDVVKNKILQLGGEVSIRSKNHQGTTVIIELPLTLSILQGILVQISNEKYVIPSSSIVQIESSRTLKIEQVQNKNVVAFREQIISSFRLRDLYNIPGKSSDETSNVLILKKGSKLFALMVDKLLGQQEFVLKTLGNYLGKMTVGISGATILGNGQVALIIDPNELISQEVSSWKNM